MTEKKRQEGGISPPICPDCQIPMMRNGQRNGAVQYRCTCGKTLTVRVAERKRPGRKPIYPPGYDRKAAWRQKQERIDPATLPEFVGIARLVNPPEFWSGKGFVSDIQQIRPYRSIQAGKTAVPRLPEGLTKLKLIRVVRSDWSYSIIN